MKRRAGNIDSGSSDEELFTYSNKQKLTFSTAIGLDDIQNLSSPSDSSDEDDDDSCDVVLEDKKKQIIVDSNNECNSMKQRNMPEILSIAPSPPPPTITPVAIKTRAARKIRRGQQDSVDKIALLKNQLNTSESDSSLLLQHIDDDIYVVEELSVLRLKIRVHGFVEKYDVKRTDPLKKLIENIAKKENVEPGHVTLNWGNTSIGPDETAKSLGLTIADIIECFIHEDEVEKENTITIKIQSANKKSASYDVTLSETVERVLTDFCTNNDTNVLKVRFTFDGERINDLKETFSKLDMMDGDVIDADLQS